MCECKSHIYIFPFYLEIVQEKVKKKKKKKKEGKIEREQKCLEYYKFYYNLLTK
jgi:hypothetical protein